jgi:putative NAD(P)-binding protein
MATVSCDMCGVRCEVTDELATADAKCSQCGNSFPPSPTEKDTIDPRPTSLNSEAKPENFQRSAKTVVIFGAGIAGLSAAHELIRLGHKVSVYEANPEAGGFFRSARLAQNQNRPSEYSWHGFGPWYHNVFDLMKQIPFDQTGSMYEKAFCRPVDFGIFPDKGNATFYDHGLKSIPKMFRMSMWDLTKWSWLMIKTWAANRRTDSAYSKLNAAEQWKPLLSERAYKTWRSCFGPWVGSDWTKVSLHHVGQFFRKQLISKPSHFHAANEEGPAWPYTDLLQFSGLAF